MTNLLKNKTFISLIILFIPFLSFLNANFQSFDNVFLNSVFLILFFVIIANFLISYIISKFTSQISYETLNLFFSFIFFILFYLFQFFKDLLVFAVPIYSAEISIIISIIVLFSFFFIFLNNKTNLLRRFVLIYVFMIFILNLSIFAINSKIFFSLKDTSDSLVFVNEKSIDYLNKGKKTNIYFVIVDAAIPLDKFDDQYQTNYTNDYLSKLNNKGFEYINNTKAAYPNTAHSLTSLFYLNYHIDEKNYKKYPLTNLFPRILEKTNIKKLALIKNLNKMDYKLKWLGNTYNDCRHNTDLCLDDNNSEKKEIIAPHILKAFLQRSPLIQIYIKSKNFLGLEIPIRINQKNNDALNIFMEKNTNFNLNDKGYFFLIHSLMPHWPYTFNSDCSLKKGLEILDLKKIQMEAKKRSDNILEAKFYKEQYECMLKRIDQFADFLNKNDPNANVVIISDHGHNIKDNFILGFDTFAMVKKNKICNEKVDENLNTANAARFLLSCTIGQKIDQLEKKLYYVYFQRGDMTIGGKLGLEILDPNDYEEIFQRFPFAPSH